jgi:predicted ribosomally synthesized peptide with SipW-like signal peptide
MKRKLAIIFGVIAVLAILSFGTYAYFTADQTAENVITTGNVKLEIHEKTATGEDFPKEGISVMPGDTVSKIVTVENTGDHPLYLRIKLTEGVSDEALTTDDCLDIDINRTNWIEKDGYYYYYRPLQSGETTEQLFSEVYFDINAVDNKYLGKYFTLNVSASAVQSENNGADVLSAVGWPEEEASS